MFQPAKAQHIQKAQLKPSGVGVPGTLSPGTPLYVLRRHPSDPGYETLGAPGDEIAMLVYIYRFTMVHKSYVYTYYIYIYGYIWLWYIYTYSNPQQDTRVIIVLEWIVAK